MALTNGLVAPWHRSAGNVYSLSFSVSFLFLFHPSFLPSSFFFPRPSFSSSFSRWFIHWILFPFRPSSFSLALFSTRCAVSSFRDGKLSPPFSLSVERVARLVTFEGLFFPCYSACWRIVSSRNGRFSQRGGRESWGNKQRKGISFSWKTENGRVACCYLWFERWKNIGGSHVGSNLFRILLRFVPYGIVTLDEFPLIFSFFQRKK